MLQESLKNLGRPSWPLSFGRETPAQDVGHGGHDSHLSSAWCCWRVAGKVIQHPLGFRQLWNKTGVEHFLRDLSRVFMAVGDANIALHPQLFSLFTFEYQSLTEVKCSWSLLQPL